MAKFVLSGFADEIASDLTSQINGVKDNGISFIEMRNVDGKSLIQHSPDQVKEIKKRLDDNGLRLSAIGSYLGKQSITEPFTHLDEFRYTLEIAEIMEVRNIRMFSFYIPEDSEPADYRSEVMDRWHQFVEAAEGTDIMLLHENEKGIYGDNAERCLDLVKEMDSPHMKLIFDPANFVQCGVDPYPDAWNMLKDYVVYYHIKDAVKATGEVRPAGYGDGNIPEMLKAINDDASIPSDREFFLSLEPHLANFQGFASLENGADSLPEGDNVEKYTLARKSLQKILNEI